MELKLKNPQNHILNFSIEKLMNNNVKINFNII